MTIEQEARQFADDTKAKLKDHDQKFKHLYATTYDLGKRIAKLEKALADLEGKKYHRTLSVIPSKSRVLRQLSSNDRASTANVPSEVAFPAWAHL
jgi:hypothetical protein